MKRRHDDEPVLITEAAVSLDARAQTFQHRTDGPRQPQQDGPDHAPPRTGTDG